MEAFLLARCPSHSSRCAFSPSPRGWAQYRSTQWTADSGLPQNSVRGIVQAADGYLWVATLDGIAKFDGIRFTVFNKSNTPGITSNRFVAMAEGDGGDLWMASEDGNLIRYHAGHFERMEEQPDSVLIRLAPSPTIIAVASGWTLTTGYTVGQHSSAASKGKRSTETTRDSFLCGGAEQGSGRFGTAICCVSRVAAFPPMSLPKTLTPARIRGVAVGGDDVVWIGTTDGRLGKLVNGSLVMNRGTAIDRLAEFDQGELEGTNRT